MILHYGGKYNGDESTLPQREHHPDAVQFREAESMKQLALIANIGCFLVMLLLAVPFVLLAKAYIRDHTLQLSLAAVLSCLSAPIHECLHAVCFRKDVYYYSYLRKGILFVVGTEDMSKSRFIFMSLCPNIVLGFIPYIIFLLFPNMVFFGVFGILCTGMGFGDYINVYNALRQMPKGSKTYLSGMHSYWYSEK